MGFFSEKSPSIMVILQKKNGKRTKYVPK